MSQKKAEEFLHKVLYRASCPSVEELGHFSLHRLGRGEHLAVSLHLRYCPHCAAELALFAGPEGEAGMIGTALSFLRRVLWISPAFPGPLASRAWGAVRYYSYVAEKVKIMIEMEMARSGYQRYRLLGQVDPPDAASTAEVWQEDTVIAESPVDDMGYFQFDRLQAALYRLCLQGREEEIWLDRMDLR